MQARIVVAILTLAGAGLMGSLGDPTATAPEAPLPPSSPEPPAAAAWLGLFLEDEPDGGARVVAVIREGPAAIAGLEEGDLLLSVNGRPVTDRLAVRRLMGPLRDGERLAIEVLRDGKVELREIVAEPPAIRVPLRGISSRALWPVYELRRDALATDVGLEVVEISAELRRFYGGPEDSGVLLSSVVSGTPAGAAGLRAGDVLVRAGGRPVRSRSDLETAFLGWPGSGGVNLRLVRDREPIEVRVAPAKRTEDAGAREARMRTIEEETAALERRLRELRRELELLREAR